MNYCGDQEGHDRGNRRGLLCDAFSVFAKQILSWHRYFFNFGINIGFVIPKEEFKKNFYYSGIELIIQKQIRKILLIRVLFFFVFFRVSDT